MREPREEVLHGWAESCHARCLVYRPRAADEVAAALDDAARRGLTVVHRGAGLSYGDAALNGGGAAVDLTALRAVLKVDAERGLVHAQAGATVEDVWRATLPHGWWPPVVPGSMKATLGGCVAMDVHGKNHAQRGSFGEHVEALTVLEPGGAPATLTRSDQDGLSRVVGAQGLTGTILEVTVRLERIRSGYLEVEAASGRSLDDALEQLERRGAGASHAVAWVDCTAPAARAGRAVLHVGRELPTEHRLAGRGLEVEAQKLPGRILGILPRGKAWWVLRALATDAGVRALNAGRYRSAALRGRSPHAQSHAAFHFLLDYVPGWKRAYRPHGFLQYQLFVPADASRYAFGEALRLQRAQGVYSYLAVMKQHRAGRFAAPYAVSGHSLALDFPVRPSRPGLTALCRSYDALLREVGGRVYAAKDSVSVGQLPERRHPLFSSDLVRRWERLGPAA